MENTIMTISRPTKREERRRRGEVDTNIYFKSR